MTTPEDALQAARRSVAQNRPGCHVDGLLEDERDYLARLELDDGGAWPLGPGRVFVARVGGSELTTTVLTEGRVRDLVERCSRAAGAPPTIAEGHEAGNVHTALPARCT